MAQIILQEGENRAILERLQRESTEFERIFADVSAKGIMQGRSVWRLLYSVSRTAKNKPALEKITREYADALVDALVKGKTEMSTELYRVPVAARWAEFLTRISKKNNKPS